MTDWVRNKTGHSSDSSSDSVTPSGLRFRVNPALPAGQREIVDRQGHRAGLVKRVGDKWTGDWDSSQKFDSTQNALQNLDSQNASAT